MTATRLTTIWCDGCPEWSDGPGGARTARDIRRWLTAPGPGQWRCDKTGDWCPKCRVRGGAE